MRQWWWITNSRTTSVRCPRAQQCGGERIHCSRRHFKPVRVDMDFIDCSACNDASSSPTFSPWEQTFCLNTKGWAPVRVRREELLNDCVIICLFLIRVKLPFPWDVKESRNSRLFRVFLHKVIFNIFCRKFPLQFSPRARFSQSTTDGWTRMVGGFGCKQKHL